MQKSFSPRLTRSRGSRTLDNTCNCPLVAEVVLKESGSRRRTAILSIIRMMRTASQDATWRLADLSDGFIEDEGELLPTTASLCELTVVWAHHCISMPALNLWVSRPALALPVFMDACFRLV